MRLLRLISIGLLMLALPLSGFGAVYKWVAPDGRVIYSDQPQPGARKLDLPAAPPAPPAASIPQATSNFPPNASGVAVPATYTKLTIVAPANDTAVRENSGTVSVALAVEPELDVKSGHKVSLLLDGKPALEGQTGTQLSISNVDRGTHVLQAQISDAEGKILISSATSSFHMQRFSALSLDNNPLAAPTLSIVSPLAVPRAPK